MDKYERNIKHNLSMIKNPKHKKEIEEYLEVRETIDKVRKSTIVNDSFSIRNLSDFLKDKPFDKVTQEDMISFEKHLNKKMEHSSVVITASRLKLFYKYLFNKKNYKKGKSFQKRLEYPNCVVWMDTTNGDNELPLENILTDKEIKKLLDKCQNSREQTILVSLTDGGLRASELCSLKIKNIGFDKQLGAYFILPKKGKNLKTGQRKIQLFLIPSSTAYIREYMNHHRFKNNPDAPFIYNDSNHSKSRKPDDLFLTPEGLWYIVKRISRESGLREIHPHTLRHQSATMCAMKGFNEAMMRERFGWSRSSKMPSYYTHIASKDTTDYIKKILGIVDEGDEEKESILQTITCWNCGYENPCTHKFCGKCSATLERKKDDVITASDIGISMQKSMGKDEIYQLMFEKLQKMEKELKELKNL